MSEPQTIWIQDKHRHVTAVLVAGEIAGIGQGHVVMALNASGGFGHDRLVLHVAVSGQGHHVERVLAPGHNLLEQENLLHAGLDQVRALLLSTPARHTWRDRLRQYGLPAGPRYKVFSPGGDETKIISLAHHEGKWGVFLWCGAHYAFLQMSRSLLRRLWANDDLLLAYVQTKLDESRKALWSTVMRIARNMGSPADMRVIDYLTAPRPAEEK